MMSLALVLFVVVALPTAFFLGRATAPASGSAPTPAPASAATGPAVAGQVRERDAFIEQLRELAWQHRDVSPELATILLDEITAHHRRLSGPHD